ncbi:MAG: SPFH domain-containing protein [Candidatus Nealsonbacteria bacterium]|nr:SPFH domain-containing protein [Candidatus Nealsonbacteria bacterium]
MWLWYLVILGIAFWAYNKLAPKKVKWELFWILLWLAVVAWFVNITFIVESEWAYTITLGALLIPLSAIALYFGFGPLNIFFTIINEGTAKAITSGGAVVKILFQYTDHARMPNGKIAVQQGAVQPSLFGLGGLQFYGIWPFRQVYDYPFSWATIDQDGEKKEHISETLDYVMLKDSLYWFDIREAEDFNLVPLNLEGLVIVRVVDPYKALFGPQNWLKITIALIQKLIRGEVAEREGGYKELVAKRALLGSELMEDEDVKEVIAELEEDYGVKIIKLEIKDIDPTANFRELTMKEIIAKQERKATVITAGAEARRVKKVYDAIRAQGATGELVRTLESLEKSADKGSKMIIPLPGLTDILEKVFGKKKVP